MREQKRIAEGHLPRIQFLAPEIGSRGEDKGDLPRGPDEIS